MRSTLSLLGLYNYDNTVLDGLTLPSNFESGDLDTLKNNLLMETAELELVYTNFDFLKYAITEWSAKQQLEWGELRKTQLYEYNPIWNADYKISDRTDAERSLTGTNDNTGTSMEKYTRQLYDNTDSTSTQTENRSEHREDTSLQQDDLNSHTTNKSGSDDTLNSVYAYNDTSTGQPRDKSERDWSETDTETSSREINNEAQGDTTQTGSTTIVNDIDNAQTGGTTTTKNTTSDTDTTENENTNTKYERWLRGNYGVTTTQKMIQEQRDLVKFNLFDYIIQEFKERFCLLTY